MLVSMSTTKFLPGIVQNIVKTERLTVAYLEAGNGSIPLVLVHGNASSSLFFQDLMLDLAFQARYKIYAPDMRGYGDTEVLPVDATRGVRDYADDLAAFVHALNLPAFHLAGWSLGGNIVMQYAIDYPELLRSLTLLAPGLFGVNNALSPKYLNQSDFAMMNVKPPVLWIHGVDDQIVSDTSFFDFGYLGQLGFVPDWPGNKVYPPQPMKMQLRTVLDSY